MKDFIADNQKNIFNSKFKGYVFLVQMGCSSFTYNLI